MRIKTIILGAAAAAFAAAPIVAQAAGRTSAPVDGGNALGYPESGTQLLVLAVVAAAIIGGIALFDEDEPSSP
jgi:hypothetical protein